MERLLELFANVDIYYQYAEGNAYYRGADAYRDFTSAYSKLSEEEKKEFYHKVKNNRFKIEFKRTNEVAELFKE